MKNVFLESHNLKNLASGFGVFNYSLIKELANLPTEDLKLTVNLKHISEFKKEFRNAFIYNRYTFFQRQSWGGVHGKYDVWHCMNQNIKIEPISKPGKYILTVHDVNFAQELISKKDLERTKRFQKKLKRADEITYISNFAKEQTHSFFEVPKIKETIIYNGNPITEILDISDFKSNIPLDKPFFYSIGDFLPKKNFESLIHMMQLIPDYNLIISGNNKKEYGDFIQNLIQNLGLENQVFLTGRVSEQAKQFYMQKCEAFLFPSIGEGFGLPPIEAMRFGKPVFLSNLASLPEIGGSAAFYWEDFEPSYMKNILEENLNNYAQNPSGFQEKLKARAAYFNWQDAAKQYLEVYRS